MAEVIDIVVRQRGARVVSRDIAEIGRSADRSANSLRTLERALLTVAGGAAVQGLTRILDTYQNLTNRVLVFSRNQASANASLRQLIDIAQTSGTELSTVSDVYQQIAVGTRALGLSTKDTLRLIDLLNKSIIISGASGQAAEGALRQFSQALAGDFKSASQEVNSVLEQLPGLADQIAKGLDLEGGGAEFRHLVKEGLVSSEEVIAALQRQGVEIDRLAQQLGGGVFERSFNRIKTAFIEFAGSLSQSTGLGRAATGFLDSIANAITNLARNGPALEAVARGLTIVAGALTALAAAGAVRLLIAGFAALLNPLVLIPAAIGAVVAGLFVFRKQTLAILKPILEVVDAIAGAFVFLGKTVGLVVSGITTAILNLPRALSLAARGRFEEAGTVLSAGFGDGFLVELDRIALEAAKIDTFSKVRGFAASLPDLSFKLPEVGKPDETAGTGNVAGKSAALAAFQELRAELLPQVQLAEDYQERMRILDDAFKKGVISSEELAEVQREANRTFGEGLLEIKAYTDALSDVDALTEGAKAGFRDFRDSLGNEFTAIRDGMRGLFDVGLSAIDEFVETGRLNFRQFADDILAQIQRVVVQLLLVKALQSAGGAIGGAGGGVLSQIAGGLAGRQHGGSVFPGQPFLVGEDGPELFVPPRTGRIVPNGDLAAATAGGGGGRPISVVMNIQTPDASSFQRSQSQILKRANRELARAERRR